jgi:DNA-binding transcriptional regulator YhcF (GntR family)
MKRHSKEHYQLAKYNIIRFHDVTSPRELASKTNTTLQHVYNVLRSNGLKSVWGRIGFSDDDKRYIAKNYGTMSNRQLAKSVGCSPGTVHKYRNYR